MSKGIPENASSPKVELKKNSEGLLSPMGCFVTGSKGLTTKVILPADGTRVTLS